MLCWLNVHVEAGMTLVMWNLKRLVMKILFVADFESFLGWSQINGQNTMIYSSQFLKLLHQKIVLEQRFIFTTRRVHCIPLTCLSKTVAESLQSKILLTRTFSRRAKNRPLRFFQPHCPWSAIVVIDSGSLCYTNVSVQGDAISTVISWPWWCCWWSRHQKKGRKVIRATVSFAASLSGKHTVI